MTIWRQADAPFYPRAVSEPQHPAQRLYPMIVCCSILVGCSNPPDDTVDTGADANAVNMSESRDQGRADVGDGGGDETDAGPADLQGRWPEFSDRGVVLEHRFDFSGMSVVSAASDPTVFASDDGLSMVFTCVHYDTDPPSTMLCLARSSDGGQTWALDESTFIPGELLRGEARTDRANLEGPAVAVADGGVHLFYSAYPPPDMALYDGGYPAPLYVTIEDGGFELSAEPLIDPMLGTPDADAVYSPVLAPDGAQWRMFYAGHCYRDAADCGARDPSGVTLLTTTSDSLTGPWASAEVVRFANDAEWTGEFVAEPGYFRVGTMHYLILTGFEGAKPVSLGLAQSPTLSGPWTLQQEPIATATGVGATYIVAASASYAEGEVRLLYTVIPEDGIQRIALMTATFP